MLRDCENKHPPTPVSCLHSRVALSIAAAFLQARGAAGCLEKSSVSCCLLLLRMSTPEPDSLTNNDAHTKKNCVLALAQSPTNLYHTNTTAAHPTSMDRARRYLMQQASSQTATEEIHSKL
jgi:hypothetical protein